MKKLYSTRVDTIMVTTIASNLDDLYDFLLDVDDNFFIENNKLYYDFGSIKMECITEEVKMDKTKLVHFESH